MGLTLMTVRTFLRYPVNQRIAAILPLANFRKEGLFRRP